MRMPDTLRRDSSLSFFIDNLLTGLSRYMNMFLSTWVLLVAGLIFALPVMQIRIKNQTDLADDARFVHISDLRAFLNGA